MSACISLYCFKLLPTFIIKETKFNYGKGENNPMESYYFYGKKSQERPFHLPKEKVREIKNRNYIIYKLK